MRTKQRFVGINPNFKSSAFRPARINHPNLPALTPRFFPISAFYPLPLLPKSLHHPSHLTLLISFYCLAPFLFHNSLSRYNSLYAINPFRSIFYCSQPSPTPLYKSSHLPVCVCQGVRMLLPPACHRLFMSFLTALSRAACYLFKSDHT